MLIIDEAQNLPLQVLEQIRILSNLETDKEKLLQIILVGQLNLQTLLRSPELRQLDQRVSIRYELKPLDADGVAAYVAHRLTIAGGSASVSFTPKALEQVHRLSGGIPRLINLICDRALLAGFSVRADADHARHGDARGRRVSTCSPGARRAGLRWLTARASLLAARRRRAGRVGAGASARRRSLYQRFEALTRASRRADPGRRGEPPVAESCPRSAGAGRPAIARCRPTRR